MAVPIAALLSLGSVAAIRALRATLDAWRQARVPLPITGSVQVNFVGVLGLTPLHETLRSLDSTPALVCLAVASTVVLLFGIFGAIAGATGALLYNVAARYGGGLVLEGTAEGPIHATTQHDG